MLEDIARLRAAGIANINVDLIAGLPHQTAESWHESLAETVATGVPHVSVYMLEVDEDSRLGRELIAGGTRYHAHFVPDEEATADFYLAACEQLEAAGIEAIRDFQFRRRRIRVPPQPQILDSPALSRLRRGRAFDAGLRLRRKSMLSALPPPIRWKNTLPDHRCRRPRSRRQPRWKRVSFSGLRLNRGVDLREIAASFGEQPCEMLRLPSIAELVADGLLEQHIDHIRLTPAADCSPTKSFNVSLGPAASRFD